MAQTTKVFTLDDSGAGSVDVGPCYFVGATGAASFTNNGDSLGTAFRTRGNGQFVVGAIHASGGGADAEAVVYLDQN